MAFWQTPISQTTPVFLLADTDSVFVAPGVTITSTQAQGTIRGLGDNHEALIYGTVTNSVGPAVYLGDTFNPGGDSGEILTIKAGGQVRAFNWNAIEIRAIDSQIANEGLVVADANGIQFYGSGAITNSGTIDAQTGIFTGGDGQNFGPMSLTNSGLISSNVVGGHSYLGSDSIDEIVNTGQMVGIIRLYGGEDTVTNGGTITGQVFLGEDNDSFTSNGGASGTVWGEDGDDTFTSGNKVDVFDGGKDNDTFRIAGSDGVGDTFAGGTGTDKVQVLGTAAATLSGFNAGASQIEEWVGNGQGLLGTSGANSFDFTALTSISSLLFIDGQDGDDTITGSNLADTLRGGLGVDVLNGAGGADTFQIAGSEGIGDTFAGGPGADKVQVLGTAAATLSGFNAGASQIEEWVGNGQGLLGTSGADSFDLTALTSISGLPFIDGQDGDDTIAGSSLADTLRGGLGRDALSGGLGPDVFDFNAIAESVKGNDRDVIMDFDRSVKDRIDLADIDAKKGVGGNNAFKFIGTKAFHDVKGELRCSDGIVKGDVNGDGVADFEIQANLSTLKGADFIL